jgi:hypothetical protein
LQLSRAPAACTAQHIGGRVDRCCGFPFCRRQINLVMVLLHPRAAALNQNDQNDDNQYTGNNPDQHCGVHKFPLPWLF